MIWLALLISLVHAGNRVGNGGNIIECPGKPGILLDFYEAQSNGHKIVDAKSRDELLKSRLNTLDKVAPKLAKQYKARSSAILQEFDFKKRR